MNKLHTNINGNKTAIKIQNSLQIKIIPNNLRIGYKNLQYYKKLLKHVNSQCKQFTCLTTALSAVLASSL